jgi:hypothetical protein
MKESKFSKFVGKLRREGYSPTVSREIAASEGAKKYGWKGMAARSAASRRAHERERLR